MEKNTYKAENMLQEKLLLYRELAALLEQEKQYILDMDLESMWTTTSKKQDVVHRLDDLKTRLSELPAEAASRKAAALGNAGIDHVIDMLPVPPEERHRLKTLKTQVDIVKQRVAAAASDNKKYITDYLGVINDLFATIYSQSGENRYTTSGKVTGGGHGNHFIRAEV